MTDYRDDLGFTFQKSKSGDVQIFHHGRQAAILRHARAADFLSNITQADFAEQQQAMARLTGNYKRGNERMSKNHPRNKH